MKTFKDFLVESSGLYPIEEHPLKRKRRLNSDYNHLMTIDASHFKHQFEQENDEQLDWNPKRLQNLRNLHAQGVKIDDHPIVGFDARGRLSVGDGRHRISHAAELGMKIIVAIHKDDIDAFKKKFQEQH